MESVAGQAAFVVVVVVVVKWYQLRAEYDFGTSLKYS